LRSPGARSFKISLKNSFRIEIRDSYIHTGSWPEPGGAGYAISLALGSSEALIENNILADANKVMVFRSSGAGSVVAYNYVDNGWIYGTEGWVEVGLNASHMAGSHHVLFEGNYAFNADSDYTHGNATYMTFFATGFLDNAATSPIRGMYARPAWRMVLGGIPSSEMFVAVQVKWRLELH
jgi:hypothetical protein